jgi:hypothetical protein
VIAAAWAYLCLVRAAWILAAMVVTLGVWASAAASPVDAAPPDGAPPPVQEVDFSDEDEGLGGDAVTTRNPTPVEFESIIPARFRVPPGPPPPTQATEPQRRGCGGCSAAPGRRLACMSP